MPDRWWPRPNLYDAGYYGVEDRIGRLAHPTHPLEQVEERRKTNMLTAAAKTVGVVWRNYEPLGDYEVVALLTAEATSCKWSPPTAEPEPVVRQTYVFYAGTDGPTLVEAPRHHRRKWTEEQWLAYHDYVDEVEDIVDRLEAKRSAVLPMVIKHAHPMPGETLPADAYANAVPPLPAQTHRATYEEGVYEGDERPGDDLYLEQVDHDHWQRRWEPED